MTLNAYRIKHGLTYEALAERIGARNANAAWRWCNGEAPERWKAAEVSVATEGEVTVRELLYPGGLPEGAVMDRPGELDTEAA